MFYADARKKDGLYHCCKSCHCLRTRKWAVVHRENAAEIARRWRKAHPERAAMAVREYEKRNPEKVQVWKLRYRRAHPEGAAQRRDMQRSTPFGKLNNRISTDIRHALKGNKKGRHWETLVGYTINDLMEHLGNLFQPGMTWGNQGEWHIDHKVPKVFFHFDKPEDPDFRLCWTLSNLQPLWAIDNLRKQARIVAVGG